MVSIVMGHFFDPAHLPAERLIPASRGPGPLRVVSIQPPFANISEPRNNLQHPRQGARLCARSPLKKP
jgi:hypothetical protein